MKYYEDPILGKGRAADVSGGTGGGGGTAYIGGNRINIDGDTISFADIADIVNVTGTSVTLQPDTAYKIYATSQAITLNANPPAAGKWAYEGHLEIFTGGTGYVVTGTNVVLANALEPDAVNNCTVRFHDGIAIIAVEDHVAGYIVVNGSTSGNGSLYYGIATSTNDYVAFDASLNGSVIPLAGAVSEGEKHVVGNGYTETTLTGAVNCGTSKFTVANLGLNNVQVTGGTMTLGDAYIPSGSTVAVSGGGLAVEKVNGNGGTIDLGGTNVGTIGSGKTMIFDGVTITSGLSSGANVQGGVFTALGTVIANSCTFANCSATYGGAVALIRSGARVTLDNCVMSGNSTGYGTIFVQSGTLVINGGTYTGNFAPNGGGCAVITNGIVSATNVVVSGNKVSAGATAAVNGFRMNNASGKLYLEGGCTVDLIACSAGTLTFRGSNNVTSVYGGASVVISSGATLDLTGNPNATPINPGGGITFGANVTVINSAGTSVSLNGGAAGSCSVIKKDGTTA
jgi:hypothetical protein